MAVGLFGVTSRRWHTLIVRATILRPVRLRPVSSIVPKQGRMRRECQHPFERDLHAAPFEYQHAFRFQHAEALAESSAEFIFPVSE